MASLDEVPPDWCDDDSWSHRFVHANGVRLHCVEVDPHQISGELAPKERPLMLFLHGFPEFWYSWRHQMRAFCDAFHVVAPDLRGYNLSDKPHGRRAYALDELVADVRALIENLGYESCVLVGHDWGGAIAWQFAHTHPEMLDRLIVMNLPHPVRFLEGLKTFAQLRRSWYILFFQLPWLPEALLGFDDQRAIASIFAAQAKNPQAFSDEDLAAFRKAAGRPGALSAMLNYYRALVFEALRFDEQRYDQLEVPTLLLWGEDDVALGKELVFGTERFARALTVEFLSDCSHWVQQDRPERVNRAMRSFLDKTESGAAKS